MRDCFAVSVGMRPGIAVSASFLPAQWPKTTSLLSLGTIVRKLTQARKCIDTINVHRTAPTNTLSTTPPERKRRINLILNPNKRIQHHRARLVQIKRIRLHLRFARGLIRVPSVDVEGLGLWVLARIGFLDGACLAFMRWN